MNLPPTHLDVIRQGPAAWNEWRRRNSDIAPNLMDANLRKANLRGANLSGVQLNLADLTEADLTNADLSGATLPGCQLVMANISQANLEGACLIEANLRETNLNKANLRRAQMKEANFTGADLRGADLSHANLIQASLVETNLSESILIKADLQGAILIRANLDRADMTGSFVYGISAWDVTLQGAIQSELVISPAGFPDITVDNLKVAQFIYLLLKNSEIRDVIDTMTSKVVLILGRFTPDRKAILDAIRDELRSRNYLPILFDFEKPAGLDLTETITLLARMAKFIIADLTEPSSIPQELQAIVPDVAIPVKPLLQGDSPYSMFKDYRKYHWVLSPIRYENLEGLLKVLQENVIAPAEAKVTELRQYKNEVL